MAEVVFQSLGKRYPNGVEALRDLNLTVADGELLVVVGPSGSGKTTLLRLIAGLDAPTQGRVFIAGTDATDLPPRRRNVALVFQRPTLYPHLTVRDNLAFGQRLKIERLGRLLWPAAWEGVRRDRLDLQERVTAAARDLGLIDLLDRSPNELSGGEQQRVALGRALVRRPAVFLLDEPLSSLDPPLRAGLRRQLHLLQRARNATMIYVTHDQTEALTLGDRVVVLDGGVVRQIASPAELYDQPANRFVAGFVGWPSMNFLDGRFVWDPEGFWFATASARWSLPAEATECWAGLGERELTLGIRPEHVRLNEGPGGCECEVVWVEAAAAATVVELARGGSRLTACSPGRAALRLGEKVMVALDMNRAHLFDRATGQALTHSAPT